MARSCIGITGDDGMKVDIRKLSLIMGPAIGFLLLACGGADSTSTLPPLAGTFRHTVDA